jgi:VIT1/CCC1 family predicted Fe2+/Mn2+ transporter
MIPRSTKCATAPATAHNCADTPAIGLSEPSNLELIIQDKAISVALTASGRLRSTLHRYLADIVYGANDGIITTFAIISGVTGAKLSGQIVLILGLANLLADGFSMGASNYLSLRSRGLGESLLERNRAARHGLATFVSFLVVGAVPLIGYLLPYSQERRFPIAILFTLCTLFAIGAARVFFTRRNWWRSGLEMLVVGVVAAVVAYGVGALLATLTATGSFMAAHV